MYRGSKRKLFDVIDLCSEQRPESSVIMLIEYRAYGLYPTQAGWIRSLYDLMDKYYKREHRDSVRIKCLQVLFYKISV